MVEVSPFRPVSHIGVEGEGGTQSRCRKRPRRLLSHCASPGQAARWRRTHRRRFSSQALTSHRGYMGVSTHRGFNKCISQMGPNDNPLVTFGRVSFEEGGTSGAGGGNARSSCRATAGT